MEKIISMEDYNQFVMDLIHIESTYKVVMHEIKRLGAICDDPIITPKLNALAKWVEDDMGGPDDLERVRKSIR